LDKLGERFELMSNMYKPFACGLVVHPVIDGCLELRAQHGLKVSDIKCIRLRVHPLVVELTGKKEPKTGLEGKFSVYHSAAVAIIQGAAGEEQYSDKVVNDPEVAALRNAVEIVSADDVAETQATIAIELGDGRILTHEVAHATGTLQKPMTDRQIEDKVRGLIRGVLDDSAGQALIRLCWSSDTIEDASALASASMPSGDDAAWSKAPSL
jgi:2-methylcitrate dehydratase PrpD